MRTLMLGLALVVGMAGAVTYTEAQRLVIWKALDAADVKATKLANATYNVCVFNPSDAVMKANAALLEQKTDEFERAVVRKYKLTERQVNDLYSEGSQKHWPQIEYNPPGC